VHFIIDTNFGKSDVPQWFNEGLAEYYQTFEIAEDIKVKLGMPQSGHLNLLQQSKLMPLDTLFNISNYQLQQTGGHSRSIFYAQSWALVHYLTQGGKSGALDKYLKLVTGKMTPEKAFQEAFQTDYKKMEFDLRKYVSQNTYKYNEITFKEKLAFEVEMAAAPLDDGATGAYLGDLLYHTNRADDAEPYLVAALKLQPDSSMANTTLGMVKLKQRKFDEARLLLEKAIAGDPKNHIAYYRYAFLLSRESRDEFGFVQAFDKSTAAKIRSALKKAIALNPGFTESYEMLAFVAVVNNDELDEAAAHLGIALKYQPGNQRYSLRIAEIHARQNKFDEASESAEKIARTSDDPETKNRAENLLNTIRQRKEFEQLQAAEKKRYEAVVGRNGERPARLTRRVEGPRPSEAEMAKIQNDARMRSINNALRAVNDGEQRVMGRITRIDCKTRPLVYTVASDANTFTLTSRDFAALVLNSLDPAATNAEIGCDADVSAFNALVTYKALSTPKSKARGELVAIEFVQSDFRIMTAEEMAVETLVIYDEPISIQRPEGVEARGANMPSPAELETQRREMMMRAMRDALRNPAEGEKRDYGYLEKIECSGKSTYFYLRTESSTLKLLNTAMESLRIVFFTPDLAGVRLGCGTKPIEFPAVFTYTEKPNAKSKTVGEIVSLEFMPKSFVLK